MNILPGNRRFGARWPVKRLEDQRLLTGRGQFIDKPEGGALWLHLLRLPYAQRGSSRSKPSRRSRWKGVEAVFSGTDLIKDDIGTIPTLAIYGRTARR